MLTVSVSGAECQGDERLSAARREAGLTQVDMAQALGVPQQHVSRVELGERRIDPVELDELARLYEPFAFFLG